MPATDLWSPDRNSLPRPTSSGTQPIRHAITQGDPFISRHQFRSRITPDVERLVITSYQRRILVTKLPRGEYSR